MRISWFFKWSTPVRTLQLTFCMVEIGRSRSKGNRIVCIGWISIYMEVSLGAIFRPIPNTVPRQASRLDADNPNGHHDGHHVSGVL